MRSNAGCRSWNDAPVAPSALRTGLCWTALALLAVSSLPAREPPGGDQDTSSPSPASANIEESIALAEDLEARMISLQPGVPPGLTSGAGTLLLQESLLGITNSYSEDGVRYFATRITVLNRGTQPLAVDGEGITLQAGRERHRWQDRPAEIEGIQIARPGASMTIREARPPESLNVPPGGSTSFWVLFAGLEKGPFIPDMTLHVPLGSVVRSIPVNLYEQARLRLEVERLGPQQSLALMTIHGPLNTINCRALTEAIEAVSTRRVARAVIIWPDSAPQPDDFVRDWLLQAVHPAQTREINRQYRQMPVLPAALRELHLTGLQGVRDRNGWIGLHETPADAVDAALASALQVLSPDDAVAAIREGHPLVRAAALRHAAGRLPADKLGMILDLANGPEPTLQKSALAALASFNNDDAIATLQRAAQSAPPEAAEAAVRSLASSRYPAAHLALASILQDLSLPEKTLIEIFSEHPRPLWREFVYDRADSVEAGVRQAALRALSRLGHPLLMHALEEALHAGDDLVREEAFQQLMQRGDRDSEELALAYSLQYLERHPPTGAMLQFLGRMRDPRVAPLLFKHLDARQGSRGSVIQVLSQVGDEQAAREIARRYGDFSDNEKSAALQALRTMESPLGKPLAMQALRSADHNLVNNAVQLLQTEEDPAVVAEMESVLQTTKDKNTMYRICMALGTIATPAARDTLLRQKDSPEEVLRRHARDGLRNLWQQSPANLSTHIARTMLEAEKLPEARRQLELAQSYDPAHPPTFVMLAQLAIKEGKLEESITHLQKAMEIDDKHIEAASLLGELLYKQGRYADATSPLRVVVEANPADHQSLSSLALATVMAGKVDEGVRLAQDGLKRFERQPVYLYNVACVYGRAIGKLKEDQNVPPDDPRLPQYRQGAVELIGDSIKLGLAEATEEADMFAFMRADPDLQSLHGDESFRKLARFDQADQPQEPPPARPMPRQDGPPPRTRPAPGLPAGGRLQPL